MIIVGLSNSKDLAERIAGKLNVDYEGLDVRDAHDEEIHVRFKHNLKGKKVVLVQSLYPHVNYSFFEVLFAASVARDLGAREVVYVAPYLAYLREDSRKGKGECVGMKVIGDLLSRNVDCVVAVEPHVHKHSAVEFSVPLHKLDCGGLLRSYVRKNFGECEVVGVGERGKVLAKHVSADSFFYDKKDKLNDFEGEGRNLVIVDDIISSGESMMKVVDSLKASKINLLTVHGLFVGDAYNKLNEKENVGKIVSLNTVGHESNDKELDVSGIIAGKLMEI